MINLLTRKLELFGTLPDDDKRLLDDIVKRSRKLGAHKDIIREADIPSDVHLVLEGFACRYKVLPNGSRQIFAYLIPGDFCDLNVFILNRMDHGIGTLSACRVVDIPRDRILEMTQRPRIARALMWATLVDEAYGNGWSISASGMPNTASHTFSARCTFGSSASDWRTAGSSKCRSPRRRSATPWASRPST